MRIDPLSDAADPTDFANSADVAEQRAELDADPDDAGFAETSRIGTATGGRTELPLEADPADVAEQDVAVPYDDER
jgi:hypothetical protein